MKGAVGDRIAVRTKQVGQAERHGEILEVHGADGAPPYVVRWAPDGHTSLFFPGPDVVVEVLATRPT